MCRRENKKTREQGKRKEGMCVHGIFDGCLVLLPVSTHGGAI